jgi:hypothetical protein
MNTAVYDAAVRAGCTERQAETLAIYVVSSKLSVAAHKLGIADKTAEDRLGRVYRRLEVRHAAAAVAKLLTAA